MALYERDRLITKLIREVPEGAVVDILEIRGDSRGCSRQVGTTSTEHAKEFFEPSALRVELPMQAEVPFADDSRGIPNVSQ
jgi:hypothetical protein